MVSLELNGGLGFASCNAVVARFLNQPLKKIREKFVTYVGLPSRRMRSSCSWHQGGCGNMLRKGGGEAVESEFVKES